MKLIVLLASFIHIHAFLDFFKSSSGSSASTSVEIPRAYPTEYDHFRGIAPHLQGKYQQETFLCDNNQRKISSASINDGYCDCTDGTDEPGTSACLTGSFYCVNKGYKPLTITSSRVDDGICDCCDGSDEGIFVKCSDRCQEMAELQRSEQNRIVNTFKTGNQLRKLWEESARAQLQQEASQVPDPMVTNKLRDQIAEVEATIQKKEYEVQELQAKVEKDVKNKIFRLLKVSSESANYNYLAQFLSSLTKALHFDEIQLNNYLSDHPTPVKLTEEHEGEGEGEGDDYEFAGVTEEGSGSTGEHHSQDSNNNNNDNQNNQSGNYCDLVDITNNPHFQVICESHQTPQAKQDTMLSILYSVIKDNRAYYETMLLLGYYRLHHTFVGAEDFVKNHMQQFGQDACPEEFAPLGTTHCEIKELLKDFYNHLTGNSEKISLEEKIRVVKDEKNKLTQELNNLENTEQAIARAKENLEKYQAALQFFHLKGQNVEVNDGKFSYTVSILENVKQKEIGGYNTVLLGDYSSIEESNEFGFSYKMKFVNGQHCHAFGARSADVTVVCGEKNVLKSAQEPSTCFYSLLMESPAACTEKYAIANGLTN
jgi:protein kinase C substrate 80K-H